MRLSGGSAVSAGEHKIVDHHVNKVLSLISELVDRFLVHTLRPILLAPALDVIDLLR